MSVPGVSIVVLTHDGRNHLATCLASLAADGWPSGDVEVVVVDNGSTDGTAAFVRAEFPAVRLVAAGRNLGFAPGVRFGAQASRGETLVLLNNDTKVEKGWLSSLVSALDRAPADVAAVTGQIVSWDGTKVDYRDTLLTFDGHAFQKDFGRPLQDVHDDPPGAARVAPCGGNMAMRKEAFLAQGGFDDDFFAYLEDVDLGLRLASRGLGTAYEPRAVIRHRSGATGEALGIFNRGFLIEKNAFATFFKNVDDELRIALLPAVLLTFLHRTERILRETAPGGGALTIDPYRDAGRSEGHSAAPRGLRRRAVRAVARLLRVPAPERGPDLAGEHSLSSLRALHRIAVDLPRLEEKRRENERLRTVSTRTLFARFPPVIVPTYPGDEELFSSDAFASLLPAGLELPRLTLAGVMSCPGR
jgi:GT2 family glycosyltransferase